jgi:integrase
MGVKVRQRDGAWWLYIDHKGKRKAKRVGTGREGERAARAAAEKIQARLVLGDALIFDDAPVLTFEDAARRWFAAYAQLGQLRVSTQALYLSALERYAFPRLGKKAATSVTREDIRTLIAELLAQGRSRSLVRNVVAPIRQAFNQLLEDGVVTVNPAAKIGRFLRDAGDPRSRIDPLTVEEEARFLDAGHRYFPRHYPMLLCALRTGLRFGELVGLQWGDLDFNGRFIDVRRSVADGGRVELPKNKRIRRVDMSRQLAEELQRLKAERAQEALAKAWGEIPKWVFCNEDGKPLWKSDFERRVFHKIFVKAALRRIRFHDLRHTFASRLLQNGESPAYVKEQMGHHSIKVTVDIYGHLVPGANRDAVDRLDVTGRNAGATARTTQEAGVSEVAGKLVELRGFEPLTPRLPALCSPN